MSRRVVRLTPDLLAELAGRVPCVACAAWETDAVARQARAEDAAAAEEAAAQKQAWLSWVLREWGSCGRAVLVDDAPVGYCCYAPAAFVPGVDGLPTAPPSPDAVLLTTAHVAAAHRGGGLGRMLVQGMARDLVARPGVRTVEVFAAEESAPAAHRGCLLPAEFCRRVGVRTQRAHPRVPRLRMDLRAAVSWKGEVEAALDRLLGVVRPASSPRPATQREAHTNSSSSLRMTALGRAPTMSRTTSPPW